MSKPKINFHLVELEDTDIVGTIICSKCRTLYAAYKTDIDRVVCPKCGNFQDNPFHKKHKEKK